MNTPQFDLGTMLSAPQTAIQQIPCDQLHPYHNHKFELYSGERLEDMVASIKENGVLSPIIVQPIENGYEILIGHNRWNASKLAGLPTVPAIVKAGLTEEEAEMYVIESNVMQRGFENLRISEQAAAVALRHSEMFSQGKRNDILRELAVLDNPSIEADTATLNPVGSKLELFYRLSFTCYAFDLKGIYKRSRYRRRAERHIFSVMIMCHEQFQGRQFFFFRQDTDMPFADHAFVCHCAVALILKVLQLMLAVHFK